MSITDTLFVEILTIDDSLNKTENKIHQIYVWKMMSEICDSIYKLQKEIYESSDE